MSFLKTTNPDALLVIQRELYTMTVDHMLESCQHFDKKMTKMTLTQIVAELFVEDIISPVYLNPITKRYYIMPVEQKVYLREVRKNTPELLGKKYRNLKKMLSYRAKTTHTKMLARKGVAKVSSPDVKMYPKTPDKTYPLIPIEKKKRRSLFSRIFRS